MLGPSPSVGSESSSPQPEHNPRSIAAVTPVKDLDGDRLTEFAPTNDLDRLVQALVKRTDGKTLAGGWIVFQTDIPVFEAGRLEVGVTSLP